MNSPINKPIVDFINDFKLLTVDSLIHFKAKVLYVVGGIPHQYECEVAIVTIMVKKLDAIYLLNSQIGQDGFEDSFIIKSEHIEYIEKESLLIRRDGKLKVYIFPVTSKSSPDLTIKELETKVN